MRAAILVLILALPALGGCIGGEPSDDGVADLADDAALPTFGAVYAFPNPSFPVQFGTTCAEKTDGDVSCGLDEPSVVVDARGYVYYTAACCFLVSSPVWVTRDAGVTFESLPHPLKDVYGNEGDLAVDDEGNVYYMDIDLVTFGIAAWDAEGTPMHAYRRPGELLVDRPWIRAGQGGAVHAVYNTGSTTVYYRSTDHAETFSPLSVATFPSALANAYSDVRRDIVGMVGYGEYMESTDAGATWSDVLAIDGCEDADGGGMNQESAAVDEAGTVWFQRTGCVVGRLSDGTWTPSSEAIPADLEPYFTWVAAGAAGGVAVAFYGRAADAEAAAAWGLEEDTWYAFVSFTGNAGQADTAWTTLLVDEDPVGHGSLGRRLGDFLSVAIGPDGSIHVAYASNPEMDDSATASYRGTTPISALAPWQALVGPFAGTVR